MCDENVPSKCNMKITGLVQNRNKGIFGFIILTGNFLTINKISQFLFLLCPL